MNWQDLYGLVSWESLAAKEFEDTPFLINPYIPKAGIVLLWGETSTGKSPFGWHIAAAIGRGTSFFGLPVEQGRVLYIEVDTPQRLVAERITALPPSPNVDFLFLPPLSVPTVDPLCMDTLLGAASRDYACVIVNTLRKVHSMNDKEPQTPKVVYEFFQKTFPGSALVFVHHTKKTQFDNTGGKMGRDKESFSGAMTWLNDAQVGIHLINYESKAEGINKKLLHHKTQVSAEYKGLGLFLAEDGASLRCPREEQLNIALSLHRESPLRGKKFDLELARVLGVSESSGQRMRRLIEDGAYPGVEWLGRKSSAESEVMDE
jgi:RecA-family ATPase